MYVYTYKEEEAEEEKEGQEEEEHEEDEDEEEVESVNTFLTPAEVPETLTGLFSDRHDPEPVIIAGKIWCSDLLQLGPILYLGSDMGSAPGKKSGILFPECRRGMLARKRVLDLQGVLWCEGHS